MDRFGIAAHGRHLTRWDTGEHRLLFTGDPVYLEDVEWLAAVLESSDRGAYVESLNLIRELDFDLLVAGRPPAARPYYASHEPG